MLNLSPRRTFLQQMSVCVVSLMLCALYFKTNVLYFHDHIKSLLTHGVSSETLYLMCNPKEPISSYTTYYNFHFFPSNQRLALKLFPSSLPYFLHIKGVTHFHEALCLLVIYHVSGQLCFFD